MYLGIAARDLADILSPETQAVFTIVTPKEVLTPKIISQGVLNAMTYFQRVMHDVLDRLVDGMCLVWLDDVVIWGNMAEKLVEWLEVVLT